MGSLTYFTLILLSLATLQSFKAQTDQELQSVHNLDLVIKNYTFRSYNTNFKTGKLQSINLPANLSGVSVDAIRLRCGSLQRYGAKIKEFGLDRGINVHPCIKRSMLVRQNLGSNYSPIYFSSYQLSGYQLISPILTLLAYNIESENSTNIIPSEAKIRAGEKPIIIDFSSTELAKTGIKIRPLCATFDQDRKKVILANQTRPFVCVAINNGHFGLVVESPSSLMMPLKEDTVSKWKIAVVSSIGAALGICLLSLLMIAMFVNAKKKARMDEMERRAYEEEALQVSMVGHVRAVTASGTRTVPTIEQYEYRRS